MFEFTSKAKTLAYILILVGVVAWVAGFVMNGSHDGADAHDDHHTEAVADHGHADDHGHVDAAGGTADLLRIDPGMGYGRFCDRRICRHRRQHRITTTPQTGADLAGHQPGGNHRPGVPLAHPWQRSRGIRSSRPGHAGSDHQYRRNPGTSGPTYDERAFAPIVLSD